MMDQKTNAIVSELHDEIYGLHCDIGRLEQENAKLRELSQLREDTCTADETETYECVRDDMGGYGKRLTVHVMECGKCGHTYEHVNGDYEFCPRCGRKVVG